MAWSHHTDNAPGFGLLCYESIGGGYGQREDIPLSYDEIPASIRKVNKCRDCGETIHTEDMQCSYCARMTDDRDMRYLDDPQRGQAKWINR